MLVFYLASLLQFLIVIDKLHHNVELSTSLVDGPHDVLEVHLEDIVTQLFCPRNIVYDLLLKSIHRFFLDLS